MANISDKIFNRLRGNKTRIRYAVVFLCLCLLMATLLSEVFIAAHAEHKCCDDHCCTCTVIRISVSILTSAFIGTYAFFIRFFLKNTESIYEAAYVRLGHITLCSLNVRLDD